MGPRSYDLAIVGAGIVGLAHALAGAARGLRVLVLDRDLRANGASIRNFGFITVTGQSAGVVRRRALRSRDVWNELSPVANIPIVQRAGCVIVHSREALAVLEQFAATEMGEQCELLDRKQLSARVPMARIEGVTGALWSPHEVRIEPRTAIPALATYLESRHAVAILRGAHASAVMAPKIVTSIGRFTAERVIVATGPTFGELFPQVHSSRGVRLCKLQMLRLAPQPGHWRLPASIMSDFALIRYRGFSELPAAEALRSMLLEQAPQIVAHGIHLIVVQNADGSLVVGDSHEYGDTPEPFYSNRIESEIVPLANDVLDVPNCDVRERWVGFYPQSDAQEWFVDAPDARTRVVQVTTGNGMSTAFALAEEVVAELCR